jgi:hypothetical protein
MVVISSAFKEDYLILKYLISGKDTMMIPWQKQPEKCFTSRLYEAVFPYPSKTKLKVKSKGMSDFKYWSIYGHIRRPEKAEDSPEEWLDKWIEESPHSEKNARRNALMPVVDPFHNDTTHWVQKPVARYIKQNTT